MSERSVRATQEVLRVLDDRSGFDHWYDDVESDVKEDIQRALSEAIERVYEG